MRWIVNGGPSTIEFFGRDALPSKRTIPNSFSRLR